tara:strand:+ start:1564 stop:1992 length:429 start_codon:yes stop_codon:yes gene_type:complete
MMNAPKTVDQKNLRKNLKSQRNLSGKDDLESKKKLERLMMEEKEILQKMETDKCRKEKRLQKSREKALIESMSLDETLEYFKGKDKGSFKEDHRIPNTRKARIHRKKVIQGIRDYKMDQYFAEQLEMKRKLKEFLESIESED